MSEHNETLADIEEELRSGEYAPLADRIHAARQRERERWELAYGADHARDAMAYFATLFNRQPDPDWNAICAKCHDGEIEPDCEYYGEPNGCNSPIYGEHPKSSPVGNAVVMRDALEKVKKLFDGRIMFQPAIREAHRAVIAALAFPARNCDRFSGDIDKLREACLRERGLNPEENFPDVFPDWLLATKKETR